MKKRKRVARFLSIVLVVLAGEINIFFVEVQDMDPELYYFLESVNNDNDNAMTNLLRTLSSIDYF